MKCRQCGAEVEGAFCSVCGAKTETAAPTKKPIYKRWWFWLIVVAAVVAIVAGGVGGKDAPADSGTPKHSSAPGSESTPEPDMTMAQKNALRSAKSYLDLTAFSRSGLIKQLEFEGYETEDATFAVDNCGADWNEQAVLKAKDYLEMTAFSRDGLIKQLEFEGFTHEEAVYGAEQNGY